MPKMVNVKLHRRAFQQKYVIRDEEIEKYGKFEKGDAVIVLSKAPESPSESKGKGRKDNRRYETLGYLADVPVTVCPKLAENISQHILRKPDAEELKKYQAYSEKEEEAFKYCKSLIKEEGLPMKLIDVEHLPGIGKLLFYFTAENRVDFRRLVKLLASRFHMRIELKQIGPRDEHKLMGGIGVCGRKICCSSFEGCIKNISIKSAKLQGLDLSMLKYTGCCGRLMCCLMYELDWYKEVSERFPDVGTRVETPEGTGLIKSINHMDNDCTVSLDGPERRQMRFGPEEIRLPGGRVYYKAEEDKAEDEELEDYEPESYDAENAETSQYKE